MPFLASLVWQWPSKIKKEYTCCSRVLLPQSHGGSIFHPEVAYSRNVRVALSLQPLSWLQPFLPCPALRVLSYVKKKGRSEHPIKNGQSVLLFFWWKVCSDSVWRMNGVIFLPDWECLSQSRIRVVQELRCIFPGIFQYNFTTACGMLSVV